MIFFFSFLIWMMLAPSLNPGNLFFALSSAGISWLFGRRIIPKGNGYKVLTKLVSRYPIAVFQGFRLLLNRRYFSISETISPDNRIDEFGKIVSITLTPEELVVFKDRNKLIVHEVKKE
ncbi:hypothetical protein [Kosmotoga pacifica]|uniref:hypothetical protein n=1 Tax=Kosmotoga pacifica TaxID=1330330 RepID=UPI00069BBCD0|nr:hypothetical protein [Kosmotoga pacifica]